MVRRGWGGAGALVQRTHADCTAGASPLPAVPACPQHSHLHPARSHQRLAAGISRRALAILHAVAGVAPGGLAAAGLLQPELLASLVHLLGSGGKESEHEAAAFVAMLIEREPSAARPLAAAGAGPALAALAGRCSDGAERERAAAALAGLRQHLGGVWQSEAPRQGRPPQAPQSLAAAAMQRVGSGGLARPPRPMLGMGRANSAPLTAVPEAAQQQGQLEPRFLEGSPGLGSRSNVSPASSFGSLQRWAASQLHNAQQQQQQQQHSSAPQQLQQSSPFAPQRPQQQAPFALQQAQQQSAFAPQQPQQQQAPFVSQQPPQQSPFAPQQAQQQFAFAAQPDASGAPQTVSGLVAALRSGQLRSQLVAAEQMGSLAGAGGRAAAIITSAGGASALAACVCDSAAGPVGLHDTLADAFEAALGESLCIAALRSLCTLAQHHLPAATALPLATSPALRLLLRGPDAQQRQLAAMLLASMQAAGADPMASGGGLFNPGDLPAQFSADSPDLLPLSSVSLLSELPHPSTLGSDAADRQLAGDTPGGVSHRRTFSTEADSPAGAAQPSALRSGGGRRSGDAAGMRLGALSQLPSAARRALGEQLAVLQRPPLPPGPWRSGELARAGSSGLHASGDLLASHEDSSGGGGGLWGLASEGSASEAATPGRAASGDLWGSDAGDPPHGGATTAGAAGDDGGDGGGGGLLLPSSDIEVCQVGGWVGGQTPAGRDAGWSGRGNHTRRRPWSRRMAVPWQRPHPRLVLLCALAPFAPVPEVTPPPNRRPRLHPNRRPRPHLLCSCPTARSGSWARAASGWCSRQAGQPRGGCEGLAAVEGMLGRQPLGALVWAGPRCAGAAHGDSPAAASSRGPQHTDLQLKAPPPPPPPPRPLPRRCRA